MSPVKTLTPDQALVRISRYCAYQERSHGEVRDKLYSFGLKSAEVEALLSRMITEGFLNEERFAKAFAGGKFRLQKWGRNKIIHELEARHISSRCIRSGLAEIDNSTYRKTLVSLLRKKFQNLNETNLFRKREKTARFAIGKGYEPQLVWEVVQEIFQD